MAQIAPWMPSAPKMAPTTAASCSAAKRVGRTWRFSHKGLDATRVALVPASFSDRGAQRPLRPSIPSRRAGAKMRCSPSTIAVLRPWTGGPNRQTAALDWAVALTTTRNRTKRFRWLARGFNGKLQVPAHNARFSRCNINAAALYRIKHAVPARAAPCLDGAGEASKLPGPADHSHKPPQTASLMTLRWQFVSDSHGSAS